ncbi:hypothetical protein NDU88_005976 [Pleurodeles waltl]|uniref:Uncharacterized protein n=1 Tax=Pleurodeles waltl TaxID=8319 RepID=A0AAV7TY48_PLEWA|nr:hypothetical protein NDU88_005976 [Pleurodeles waltl]
MVSSRRAGPGEKLPWCGSFTPPPLICRNPPPLMPAYPEHRLGGQRTGGDRPSNTAQPHVRPDYAPWPHLRSQAAITATSLGEVPEPVRDWIDSQEYAPP